MKLGKSLLAAAMVFCMAVAVAPLAAFADNTYTVTVRTGSYGAFDQAGSVRERTLTVAGGSVNLAEMGSIYSTDSDGVHVATSLYCADLAAQGNAGSEVGTGDVLSGITENRVYVAVYDAQIGTVAFTVQYVDADGVQVAPAYIGHGRAGEAVSASPVSVANYSADSAAAQTITLNADASKNVITFTYTQNANVVTTTTTTTETTENVVTVGGTTVAAGTGTGTGNGAGAGAADAGTTIPDEEVPLAGGESTESTENGSTAEDAGNGAESSETIEDEDVPQDAGPARGVGVGLAVTAAVAAAGGLLAVVVLRKKKKAE